MNIRPAQYAARGFTLIETLVAILLLALLAVGITSLNGQLFMRSSYMRNLQIGSQLQQACLEEVLAQRKRLGYNATFSCSALDGQGFTLSAASAPSVQYCPTGLSCRQISLKVSGNGINASDATLLLVDY